MTATWFRVGKGIILVIALVAFAFAVTREAPPYVVALIGMTVLLLLYSSVFDYVVVSCVRCGKEYPITSIVTPYWGIRRAAKSWMCYDCKHE